MKLYNLTITIMSNIFTDLINTKQFLNTFRQFFQLAEKKKHQCYLTSDGNIAFSNKDLIHTKSFQNVLWQLKQTIKKKWYECYITDEWHISFMQKKITFDSLEKSRDHRTL